MFVILLFDLLMLAAAPVPPVFTPAPKPAASLGANIATPAPTVTPLPTPAQQHDVTKPSVLDNASSITARLSSERSYYESGEPIKITVELKNNGSTGFSLPPLPPWFLIHLVVSNQAAKVIEASGTNYYSPHAFVVPSHLAKLQPSSLQVLTWDGATAFDLRYWNVRLSPGSYTIQAVPRVESAASTQDKSIRSNVLKLSVH